MLRIAGSQMSLYGNLGSKSSPGNNHFHGNSTVAICNETDTRISALGNEWDPYPLGLFESENCSMHANISNPRYGSVHYEMAGDSLALFPGTEKIRIGYPLDGKVETGSFPRFRWHETGLRLIRLAVFQKEILVVDGNIKNTADIIWDWNSGMSRGAEVGFEHGVASGGKDSTEVLVAGKAYYWAVWGWDDNGEKVIASSQQHYFKKGPL